MYDPFSMTEIFALLVLALVVGFFFLMKENRSHGEKINEKLNQFEKSLMELFEKRHLSVIGENRDSMGKFAESLKVFEKDFGEKQEKNFSALNRRIDERLDQISRRVQENLNEGFKKTNETFTEVMARMSKIDEAQKKIEKLSTDVVSLQDVLTDKKSRGIFGEVQLGNLLSTIFGDNKKIYKQQHKLSNGKIVDVILFLPEPLGSVCVDSKFPLENYQKMYETSFSEHEKNSYRKEFKQNIKKHIDDISSKYIIPGETGEQAIMFLPAEAIFAELHAYHEDLIAYARKHNVWITSPTTFLASLTSVQVVLKDIERSRYAHVIQEELGKLAEDFRRYQSRWDNLSKHIKNVSKDVEEIHVTTDKISSKFNKIQEVDFQKNTVLE